MNYFKDYKLKVALQPLASELYLLFCSYLEDVEELALTENRYKLMKESVQCFLLNAGFHLTKDNNRLPVMFRKGYYSTYPIYNGKSITRKVSWRYTMSLFEMLKYYNLADFEKGEVTDWVQLEGTQQVKPLTVTQSKCIIKDILWQKIVNVNHIDEVKVLTNVVHIKDKHKVLIEKRLSSEEKDIVVNLQEWNKLLFSKEIELDNQQYDIQGYKVYNNSSFKQGGRTYLTGVGENMRLLKAARRNRIKVDGDPTVEIDYKSLHARMIAEIEGIILAEDFDPYSVSVEDYDSEYLRDLCKIGFMCLLGSKNRGGAIRALNDHIAEEKEKDKDEDSDRSRLSELQEEGKMPEVINTGAIVDALFEHNNYAIDWFFTQCSLKLQNIDSKIMDYCINAFTQSRKFILPIHDSMIVMRSDLEEGKRIMEDAYEKVLGSKHNCKLKVIDYYGEDNG